MILLALKALQFSFSWITYFLIRTTILAPCVGALPRSEDYGVISKYLYYDFSATSPSTNDESMYYPIQEYLIHLAPGEDFELDEIGEENKMHHNDHVQPYFLRPDYDDTTTLRVVQFYSPFVGDCVLFRPRYIQLAKEINSRLPSDTFVEFHAVSCSEFSMVCQNQRVTTYPTIKVFPRFSNEGKQVMLNSITVEVIAEALGIFLTPRSSLDEYVEELSSVADHPTMSILPHHRHHHDALGVISKVKQHTKKHSFIDAALSCTFALENSIFPSSLEDKPLTEDRKAAFQEWVDLLYWTLPPIWKIHILINDIRTHFHAATSSKKNLVQMVRSNHDVVHEHEDNRQWTLSCRSQKPQVLKNSRSHSESSTYHHTSTEDILIIPESRSAKSAAEDAYLCGLWNLLHIVSIGVSERHKAVLGQRDRVSTYHAAQTIRNYIDKFVTCEKCRHYFLEVYDKCGFNLCKRLKQPKSNNHSNNRSGNSNHPREPSEASWNELALWLWELHNDVNVKMLRESDQQLPSTAMKKQKLWKQEDAIRWPSREACPKCWRGDGSWDNDAVYGHLKQEYWPSGPQHFRYVVLGKKTGNPEQIRSLWTRIEIILFRRYGLVMLVLLAYLTSLVYKKWNLVETGKHKKFDRRNSDIGL